MKEKFLDIIRQTSPGITESDFHLPVRDTGIDSIDLITIRVTLEKYFNYTVADAEWFQLGTLEEVFALFSSKNFG